MLHYSRLPKCECPGHSPTMQSNKMRTYRLFKAIDNYKCEDYLHQVTNTRHRIALTKLRLSNHKLAIETGRYSRPRQKPAESICPICKIEMEDEYHFLNICPAYQEKRCSLLQSWTKVVETLSEKDQFGSTSEFSVSNFDISTPSPLFNVVTR